MHGSWLMIEGQYEVSHSDAADGLTPAPIGNESMQFCDACQSCGGLEGSIHEGESASPAFNWNRSAISVGHDVICRAHQRILATGGAGLLRWDVAEVLRRRGCQAGGGGTICPYPKFASIPLRRESPSDGYREAKAGKGTG